MIYFQYPPDCCGRTWSTFSWCFPRRILSLVVMDVDHKMPGDVIRGCPALWIPATRPHKKMSINNAGQFFHSSRPEAPHAAHKQLCVNVSLKKRATLRQLEKKTNIIQSAAGSITNHYNEAIFNEALGLLLCKCVRRVIYLFMWSAAVIFSVLLHEQHPLPTESCSLGG